MLEKFRANVLKPTYLIEIWSNLTYDETAGTLWQRANLVQLPYKNCKPAYFYSDWARAGVNQTKDLLDQKFDFLKLRIFRLVTKIIPPFKGTLV